MGLVPFSLPADEPVICRECVRCGAVLDVTPEDHLVCPRCGRVSVWTVSVNGQVVAAGREAGLAVMNEGFPDRGYNPDGTLMARKLPGALLRQPEAIAANAVRLATQGIVFSAPGGEAGRIPVETLCLHGDNPAAVEAAKAVRAALDAI